MQLPTWGDRVIPSPGAAGTAFLFASWSSKNQPGGARRGPIRLGSRPPATPKALPANARLKPPISSMFPCTCLSYFFHGNYYSLSVRYLLEAALPNTLDQVPFGGAEFAENPEPRCPCILLLDTSGSMKGEPIAQLNEGLVTFKDELSADALAQKRVEVALITFGPVQVHSDFQTADLFRPPHLETTGDTPMGAAILQALAILDQRKQAYKSNGISYYRPWIFLVTDGAPTDAWKEAAKMVHAGEEAKALSFFAVGVEGANFETLEQITVRKPLKLKELRFRDLFIWLSNSLSAVSRSNVDEQVPLQNPTTPEGWASV